MTFLKTLLVYYHFAVKKPESIWNILSFFKMLSEDYFKCAAAFVESVRMLWKVFKLPAEIDLLDAVERVVKLALKNIFVLYPLKNL